MKKQILALVLCLFAAPLAAKRLPQRTRGVPSTQKTAQMAPTARIAKEIGVMPGSKTESYLHKMPAYQELKKLEQKNLAKADPNISSRQQQIARLKSRLDQIVQQNKEKIKDGYIKIVKKDLKFAAGTTEAEATELRVADLRIMMHKQPLFKQRIKQFFDDLEGREEDMMFVYGQTQDRIDRLQKEVAGLLSKAGKPHREQMNRLEKQIKHDPKLRQLTGRDRITQVKKRGVVR